MPVTVGDIIQCAQKNDTSVNDTNSKRECKHGRQTENAVGDASKVAKLDEICDVSTRNAIGRVPHTDKQIQGMRKMGEFPNSYPALKQYPNENTNWEMERIPQPVARNRHSKGMITARVK